MNCSIICDYKTGCLSGFSLRHLGSAVILKMDFHFCFPCNLWQMEPDFMMKWFRGRSNGRQDHANPVVFFFSFFVLSFFSPFFSLFVKLKTKTKLCLEMNMVNATQSNERGCRQQLNVCLGKMLAGASSPKKKTWQKSSKVSLIFAFLQRAK